MSAEFHPQFLPDLSPRNFSGGLWLTADPSPCRPYGPIGKFRQDFYQLQQVGSNLLTGILEPPHWRPGQHSDWPGVRGEQVLQPSMPGRPMTTSPSHPHTTTPPSLSHHHSPGHPHPAGAGHWPAPMLAAIPTFYPPAGGARQGARVTVGSDTPSGFPALGNMWPR